MNIVLIGYRGTGKSVVGRILADRLGRVYVGMDDNIVKRAGMPIPQIVEQFGWSRFRDIETEEALDLSGKDQLIIDTGGGVIERPDNIPALKENGVVFRLNASVDTIVRRIRGGDQRPALTEGKTFTDEVAQVLEERLPRYTGAAQYEIDTDDLTPEQVAEKIIAMLDKDIIRI
jgi:shikimate kinase